MAQSSSSLRAMHSLTVHLLRLVADNVAAGNVDKQSMLALKEAIETFELAECHWRYIKRKKSKKGASRG